MTGEQTFSGGVFSERIEDGRAGAEIELSTSGVVARTPDGQTFVVPFGECQIDVGGSSGRMVFCRNADRSVTIFCEDRRFAEALRRASGGVLAEQLAGKLKVRAAARRRGRLIGTVCVVAIVVLLLAAYRGISAGARAAVHAMPTAVDEKIGQLAFESMDLGGPEVLDPVVVGAVQSMVDRLAPHAEGGPFDFRVRVVDSPMVNAFALPGGRIVVFTGLLAKAERPEQVAGVISHEMAHVTRRHGLERIAASIGLVTAVQILLGDTQGLIAFGAELFTMASVNSYSRGQEADADSEAVRMLHAAAIDPTAFADFFETLRQEEGDLPEALSWISTHPQTEARIAAVRDQAAAMPAREYRPLEIPWAEVRMQVSGQEGQP